MNTEAAVKAFNAANLQALIPGSDFDEDDGWPKELYRAGTDFFVTFTFNTTRDEAEDMDGAEYIFKVTEAGVSLIDELPVSAELVDGDPFTHADFPDGARVKLKANPDEGIPEQRGTVLSYSNGVYMVSVDEEDGLEGDADGLVEVPGEDLEAL